MTAQLPIVISNAVLRMRGTAPFFAVLTLHTEWKSDPRIGTAATDGTTIWFNPDYVDSLTVEQLEGLVAHEVLHVALRHCSRCNHRCQTTWNVAADVVVNGMVEGMGLKLPNGAIRDRALEGLQVEEVFKRIGSATGLQTRKLGARQGHKARDLMPPPSNGSDHAVAEREREQGVVWRDILRKALTVQRLHDRKAGTHGLDALREISGLLDPQLDWRTMLWRYVVRVPHDYAGWDRRHVHRGIFVEHLDGETLNVAVCCDTSASVDADMLRDLLSELQGIRNAHPSIAVAVYFADTTLHGPFWLSRDDDLPIPIGGGGTSFEPFFQAIAEHAWRDDPSGVRGSPDLIVYATDGWADLPAEPPEAPVLWVVPAGERVEFDWGDVAFVESP